MNRPFEYPSDAIIRRHAPQGYQSAGSFRPWLRDDFSFRCVFCLLRETWVSHDLQVEHFEPVALAPERELVYINLLYACHVCNGKKGTRSIPDPCVALLHGDIALGSEGKLVARTKVARAIILELGLNTKRQCKFREMWSKIVEMAGQFDPDLFRQLMGYPESLPDLQRLHPPEGNAQPEGVEQSHFARRERGELPETY